MDLEELQCQTEFIDNENIADKEPISIDWSLLQDPIQMLKLMPLTIKALKDIRMKMRR